MSGLCLSPNLPPVFLSGWDGFQAGFVSLWWKTGKVPGLYLYPSESKGSVRHVLSLHTLHSAEGALPKSIVSP